MKALFLLSILFTSIVVFPQTKPAANKSSKESKQFLPLDKAVTDDKQSYSFSDIIEIENGKDEKVPITFSAVVPIDVWKKVVKDSGFPERLCLQLIAKKMSISAQYTLSNTLSFEPFKKQFIFYSEGRLLCNYKMSARNGFGNLVETSEYVSYDTKENTKLPLPKTIDDSVIKQ